MANVADLSAPYGNFMLSPRSGSAICEVCFDLTDGHRRCYSCSHARQHLDAIAPISYSVAHEQLHHALAGYKRAPARVAKRFEVELAAVLWRYLVVHESCIASAAGTDRFHIVTTVPSSSTDRERTHPLPRIVGRLVGPTRARYRRLLRPSGVDVPAHTACADRFKPIGELDGDSVLLVDDTWTTGANAQSAAAALKSAGARVVGAVVIGRHLSRRHGDNDARLAAMPTPFEWDLCAHHPGAKNVV